MLSQRRILDIVGSLRARELSCGCVQVGAHGGAMCLGRSSDRRGEAAVEYVNTHLPTPAPTQLRPHQPLTMLPAVPFNAGIRPVYGPDLERFGSRPGKDAVSRQLTRLDNIGRRAVSTVFPSARATVDLDDGSEIGLVDDRPGSRELVESHGVRVAGSQWRLFRRLMEEVSCSSTVSTSAGRRNER